LFANKKKKKEKEKEKEKKELLAERAKLRALGNKPRESAEIL